MIGRRSFGWTYNQKAKTKATEALERSCREAAAAAEMYRHAAEYSNKFSRASEGAHKRTRCVGDHGELALLKSLAGGDDILAGLIKQQELVDGLMKLLKISDTSLTRRPASSSNSWVTMRSSSSWLPRRGRRPPAERCCMRRAVPQR